MSIKLTMEQKMKMIMEFDKMYLNEIQEKDDDTTSVYSDECPHNDILTDVDGFKTICQDCGRLLGEKFVDNLFDENIRKVRKAGYTPTRHLRFQFQKFNEQAFNIDFSLFPNDIQGIRKVLRKLPKQKKINARYDVFIWKVKNDVKLMISRDDMITWENEFKKKRGAKAKDFMYDKFNNHPKYNVFAPLVKRVCQPKKPKAPQSN